MSDGLEGILPTVIGGAVALKFLDVATEKRGKALNVHKHVKSQKAKKKKKLKKVV